MQGAVHTARVDISAQIPSEPPPEDVLPIEVRFDAPEQSGFDSSMGLSFIDNVQTGEASGVEISDSILEPDPSAANTRKR